MIFAEELVHDKIVCSKEGDFLQAAELLSSHAETRLFCGLDVYKGSFDVVEKPARQVSKRRLPLFLASLEVVDGEPLQVLHICLGKPAELVRFLPTNAGGEAVKKARGSLDGSKEQGFEILPRKDCTGEEDSIHGTVEARNHPRRLSV